MKYLKLFENFNKNEYKNIVIGKGPKYDIFIKEFAKLNNNKNILPIYINGTDSNEIRGIRNWEKNGAFELSTSFVNNPNRNYTWPEVIYTYKNLDVSHKNDDIISDEIANITSGYLFFDFKTMNLCLQEIEYPESFLIDDLKEYGIDFDTNKPINLDKSLKTRKTLQEILRQCGFAHEGQHDKNPLMVTYFENAQKTGVLNPGDLDHFGYFKIISVE
jgi:hypothetical protein